MGHTNLYSYNYHLQKLVMSPGSGCIWSFVGCSYNLNYTPLEKIYAKRGKEIDFADMLVYANIANNYD